jgi:4-amino-4-deoxy-L-arabinose transferase
VQTIMNRVNGRAYRPPELVPDTPAPFSGAPDFRQTHASEKGRVSAVNTSVFVIVSLYLLLYILPLGVRPLFLPDETRYFEIPREMIATGDWVVPRLDGLRYFEKPVMGYWVNAISMLAFGENAFAARFPCALSVGLSALAIFMLARRFAGGGTPALLAVTVFLTSIEVLALGTFCVLDNLLSMLITAAMVSFYFAVDGCRTSRATKCLLFSGVCCGAAFLTKGFIAVAVPALTLCAFAIWEGRLRWLLKTAWIPAGAATLVALPWSLMIHFREGDFWHYFFWVEHVQRFLSPGDGQHPEAFWFFIPVMLAGTLPWSALLPAVIQGLNKIDIPRSLFRFLVCWLAIPFLFFSASSGKLVTYILPCFPPAAVLMALGLWNYFKQGRQRAYRRGAVVWAGLTLSATVVLAVNQFTGVLATVPYGTGEAWKWVLGCTGLAGWGGGVLWSTVEAHPIKKLQWFALAGVFFFAASTFIFPDFLTEKKAPGPLLERNRHLVSPASIVVADGYLIRAACAYLKRDDIRFFLTPDELTYGLDHASDKYRVLDSQGIASLIENRQRTSPPIVLVVRVDQFGGFMNDLPAPDIMDVYGNFAFMVF